MLAIFGMYVSTFTQISFQRDWWRFAMTIEYVITVVLTEYI